MKTFLKTTGIIMGMVGILAFAQFVIAGGFNPAQIVPTVALPSAFIDQSATAQVKTGKLKIGATGDPATNATLDIAGTAQVISFIGTSNTTVAGKLYLAGDPNAFSLGNRNASDPALTIERGNIKSTQIVVPPITVTKPLCANSAGLIILCP